MEEKFSAQLERLLNELPHSNKWDWGETDLLKLLIAEAKRREDWEDRVGKELYSYLGVAV